MFNGNDSEYARSTAPPPEKSHDVITPKKRRPLSTLALLHATEAGR